MENIVPNHIAIIPDGNRRWAKEKGMKSWEGHEEGALTTEKLIRKAFDKGVKCFSIWGSSLENLQKRPLEEKMALLRIYKTQLEKLIENEDVHKNQTKISVIGRWEENFPDGLKKVIKKAVEATKDYTGCLLNIFLAYSGDDEMVEAVKKIVASGVKEKDITKNTIKENLMTKDLPPVDFLIRTGGEPHLSAGFMMWDLASSQLYFSKKYYPDFLEEDLEEALDEYAARERRHGK